MQQEIISYLLNAVTILAVVFTAFQIKLLIHSNHFNMLSKIYEEHLKKRKCLIEATKKIDELITELKNNIDSDFCTLYSNSKYDPIREISYHWEYIGVLISKKMLSFRIIFELFPFPDIFWAKAQELIKIVRKNYVFDFWIHIEHLNCLYEKERIKKNKKFKDTK
jgi:hypothetical protein